MENNTLLGQTREFDVVDTSGVFQPNRKPVVTSGRSDIVSPGSEVLLPKDLDLKEEVEVTETNNTNNLLMYVGAGLLLYFFVFKKK